MAGRAGALAVDLSDPDSREHPRKPRARTESRRVDADTHNVKREHASATV